MTANNQTLNMSNIAFPITDNFVKIGNLAYPIKHSFVVGERWIEDPNAPAILECYNYVYTPPVVPIWMHFRTSGNFYASMKYSFSNYPIATLYETVQGPYSMQRLDETEGTYYSPVPGSGLDKVFYGVGYHTICDWQKSSFPPVKPPVKTLTTQTWRSPNVGTIWRPNPDLNDWTVIGDGWFSNMPDTNIPLDHPDFFNPPWGTDFVMWVYDWEWLLDGEFRRFDPKTSLAAFTDRLSVTNAGVNDGLFQPGQIGVRVISRKYWNAPWERYPHL